MKRSTAWLHWVAVQVFCIAGTTSLLAEDVTLRMKGGGFEISGNLQSYDGKAYIVRSDEFGNISLNADRFDCIGGGCPGAANAAAPPVRTANQAAIDRPAVPASQLGDTTFVGGSAIGTQYIPELISAYAAANGYIVNKSVGRDTRDLTFSLTDASGKTVGRIFVKRRGVREGMNDLLSGAADLVWSGAQASDSDAAAFARQGINLRSANSEHIFALDALAILVHPKNALLSLSIEQIADVFAGRITDWSGLGAPPGRINVYAPSEGFGATAAFENLVLNPRGLKLTPSAIRPATATEWSDAISADPQGIGFNLLAYIRETKPLNIRQSCGLVSKPSLFSAKTEEFPLARRLYFYTKGEPTSRLARELLAFSLSPKAQVALKNAHFVDQAPEQLPFREQASRIAYALTAPSEDFSLEDMPKLLTDISRASRLSTTFRFAMGSAFLDTKAEQDVARLAQELKKPDYNGKTILLLGFADAVGLYDVNLEVSKQRARTLKNALIKAGFAEATARGYGELAPVACNNTAQGRHLNRRVEVWIK